MPRKRSDDAGRLEALQQLVRLWLTTAGLDDGRAADLSDHENVVRSLPLATDDSWDLTLAAVVHLAPPHTLPSYLYGTFTDDIFNQVERLVAVSGTHRPVLSGEQNSPRIQHPFDSRWSTYIFSRIALGLLAELDDPENAIRLHESIVTLFLPYTTDQLSGIPLWLAPGLSRSRLQTLYERVGRHEEALQLLTPAPNEIGWDRTRSEHYEPVVRNFNGWLALLVESGGVTETKRMLDLLYRLIAKIDGIDQEDRDQLRECPLNTRQFWAWYYGWALGQIVGNKTHVQGSLIEELQSGEWDEGWHAAGLLAGSVPSSWQEWRRISLRLYNSAEIEYRQVQSYSQFGAMVGMPWGSRQPPHLSAQSDLYWAMRVGFADAHLKLGQESAVTAQDILAGIERLQTSVSSNAQHTLRIEHEMDQHWSDIERGLPPTEDFWEDVLNGLIGSTWQVLPHQTKSHLVQASARRHGKEWDEQRVALARAVESLFQEVIGPKVRDTSGTGIPELIVQRRGGSTGNYRAVNWHRIPLWGWARILETLRPGGDNEAMGDALAVGFPRYNPDALAGLCDELRLIGDLRGDASHHSNRSVDDRDRDADDLWSLVVGASGAPGFIARFCDGLGLVGGQ